MPSRQPTAAFQSIQGSLFPFQYDGGSLQPIPRRQQLTKRTSLTLSPPTSIFTIRKIFKARTAVLLAFIERRGARERSDRYHESKDANEEAVELHVV
ncbi:uncharacterized protein K444DRAFT_619833 [Hyaloscypha bicolor E]|uniref:Uncharacterized protein n=1 Tax=Hyaloscypha bicolor E TaxID=1095630 RepID=A0A2J6SQZ0_9HELO|nr:uncharacterized protein K444DRAFT_619833 [Hyaloscypha bicolor E]PMD53170.1 hypothetical protein K444DRAFT_619833 [Hyaloscypha bicolor E]